MAQASPAGPAPMMMASGLERIMYRHCEPTGRREAPPDDHSAKQSIAYHVNGLDCFVAHAPRNGDRDYFPHTSPAISTASFSFAHCSSSERILPSSVEAKPHCGDKAS